ncbi:MAG: beta-lactamase family protein [Saprospiraceae bacterium]|nr:beta-lactamase family protein [Saprospiraceae bacterium]
MKQTLTILLICIGFLFRPSSLAQEIAYDISAAQALAEGFYEEENIQGMSVAVSIDNELVYSEGFGFTDLDNTIAVEADKTMFRIASLSKPLTSLGLAKLVETGKMDFAESFYTYVPDFPKKNYDFTIQQLASHTAGIRHYKGREGLNNKPYSIVEGLDLFKDSKLLFEPGSSYKYSTYGWNMISVAMQNAAEMDFEAYMKEEVLDPLGMNNTLPDKGAYDDLPISGFYVQNGKGVSSPGPEISIYFKLAGGGYLSTSEDLVKMGNAMIYEAFLSPETIRKMTTSTTLSSGKTSNYGIGWGLSTDKDGWLSYSHSGGTVGGVSKLIVYPEQRAVVAMVANENCDYVGMGSRAREIVKALLN